MSIESQVLYHAPLSFKPRLQPVQRRAEQVVLDEAIGQAGETSDEAGDAEQVAKALIEEEGVREAYVVDEEDMKVFVNSERWTLGESA
jgi:phosphatidylinositol glycan class S